MFQPAQFGDLVQGSAYAGQGVADAGSRRDGRPANDDLEWDRRDDRNG